MSQALKDRERRHYRLIRVGRALGWAACVTYAVAVSLLLASVLVSAR